MRGKRAENDAGEHTDQHIVVADADPFLAAAGTMQAIAAVVADRLVLFQPEYLWPLRQLLRFAMTFLWRTRFWMKRFLTSLLVGFCQSTWL